MEESELWALKYHLITLYLYVFTESEAADISAAIQRCLQTRKDQSGMSSFPCEMFIKKKLCL